MSTVIALPAPSDERGPTLRPLDPSQLALEGVARLHVDDPTLYRLLEEENARQQQTLMMVASSSVADTSVLACAGSVFSNVTSEGYPGRRYHGGCEVVDDLERLAIARACDVFHARDAVVQPHSGSSANLAVLTALLQPGDRLLGLDLDAGGHLTHGSPASISGRHFESFAYGVGADGLIDYDAVADQARQVQPRLIVCGASAYPRALDFARFRRIAHDVGAYLLADISHIAGLVAAGLHPSPIDHAHVTTTSTYKQLCGPRGGLILFGRDGSAPTPAGTSLADLVRHAVFPGTQGTPDFSAIAAKARALALVNTPEFTAYAFRLVDAARAVADQLSRRGFSVVTQGTDTHMVLLDLRPSAVTGAQAEAALEACGIVTNRNRVPGDTTPVRVTGGLRLGTNSLAVRGITGEGARYTADLVADVLDQVSRSPELPPSFVAGTRAAVSRLCSTHPLPGYTVAA